MRVLDKQTNLRLMRKVKDRGDSVSLRQSKMSKRYEIVALIAAVADGLGDRAAFST